MYGDVMGGGEGMDVMTIKKSGVAVGSDLKTLVTTGISLDELNLNHPITSLVRWLQSGLEFDCHFINFSK